MSRNALDYLASELSNLEKQNLLRERARDPLGETSLDLCSNDYLGYRATGRLIGYAGRAARENPPGSGASRLGPVRPKLRARILDRRPRTIRDRVAQRSASNKASGTRSPRRPRSTPRRRSSTARRPRPRPCRRCGRASSVRCPRAAPIKNIWKSFSISLSPRRKIFSPSGFWFPPALIPISAIRWVV